MWGQRIRHISVLSTVWRSIRVYWGGAWVCVYEVYGGCIEVCWGYTEGIHYGVLRGYVGVYWGGSWGCMVGILRCVEDTLRRCIMVYWEGMLECIDEVVEGVLRIHWEDALWCIERVCLSLLRRLLRVCWGYTEEMHYGVLRGYVGVYWGGCWGCIEVCWGYTEEMHYGVLRGHVGVYWGGCWGCMVGVLSCVENTLRRCIMVYWEGMLEYIEVVEGVWWVYWGVLRIHWGDALWCIERVRWSVLRRYLRVYWWGVQGYWGHECVLKGYMKGVWEDVHEGGIDVVMVGVHERCTRKVLRRCIRGLLRKSWERCWGGARWVYWEGTCGGYWGHEGYTEVHEVVMKRSTSIRGYITIPLGVCSEGALGGDELHKECIEQVH